MMHEERTRTRRQRLVEAVLACATVLALCTVVLADPSQPTRPAAFLAAVGFGVLAIIAGIASRSALALTILSIFAYYAVGLPPLGMVLPAVGALYLTASRGRTVWAIGAAVVLLVVATYFRVTDEDPAAGFTGYEYVTEIALAAASIALGVAVRSTRKAQVQGVRIAELVAAEQASEAARQLHEERLRISRDLHDSVGHQLTVAALHAAVASEALEDESAPPAARAAVEQVRTANAETLRELRRSVRLLRTKPLVAGRTGARDAIDDDDGQTARDAIGERGTRDNPDDPLGVTALTRTAEHAGLQVDVDVTLPLPSLLGDVDEPARGILTEAVTNVLRHAHAEHLRLTVNTANRALRIEVRDDGAGAAAADLNAGHGIKGMRERAERIGGSLRIDTAPERGCSVQAVLPLARAAGEPTQLGQV